MCSGICRAASNAEWPGGSACQGCSVSSAQAMCQGLGASSYSPLPVSSADVLCPCYTDVETEAPRVKSSELWWFYLGPPFPKRSASCRYLGQKEALTGPRRT